jgi:hypothetical protein
MPMIAMLMMAVVVAVNTPSLHFFTDATLQYLFARNNKSMLLVDSNNTSKISPDVQCPHQRLILHNTYALTIKCTFSGLPRCILCHLLYTHMCTSGRIPGATISIYILLVDICPGGVFYGGFLINPTSPSLMIYNYWSRHLYQT